MDHIRNLSFVQMRDLNFKKEERKVTMKNILFTFLFAFIYITSSFSQNFVISRLKQPPPNSFRLSDLWSLELINTTRNEITGYVVGTLTEEKDGLLATAKSKSIRIKPGINTFTAKDFKNPEISYYNEKYKQVLLRTGEAPDGDYVICVTVYNDSDEIIGFENCVYHSIRKFTPIILISPTDNEEIEIEIEKSSVNRLDTASGEITVNRQSSSENVQGTRNQKSAENPSDLKENDKNLESQNLIAQNYNQMSQSSIVFQWNPLPQAETYVIKIVEIVGSQTPFIALRDNKPFLLREISKTPFFVYPIFERKFQVGKRYAWQVYVKNFERQTASEIWTFKITPRDNRLLRSRRHIGVTAMETWSFKIGAKPEDISEQDTAVSSDANLKANNTVSPCGNLPNVIIANSTPDNKDASEYVGNYIKVGHFKMKVLQASGSSSSLTGNGSIVVPWLKTPIAVEFKNIKINSDTVMFQGEVYSEKDQTPDPWPYMWGVNVVGNFNWTVSQIKKLNNWLHNKLSGWPAVNKLVKDFDLNQMVQNYTNNPLKLPLGFNNIKGHTIAISEMKFEPTTAKLNCLAIFPVEDDTLAFKGSEIIFDPAGPKSYQGELSLIEDVSIVGNIPNGDSYELVIKKKTGKSVYGLPKGTYINWDCEGFNTLNLDCDILFPRSWLIPSPDDGQRARANFAISIEHWEDILVKTSLKRCKIVGSSEIEIEIKEMWFDNSVSVNPASLVFPSNYPQNLTQGPDFTGFFVNNAIIYLPKKIFSLGNDSITIQIGNLIINKHGITGNIAAVNLAQFNLGKINSLTASIDSLKLVLLNSSITEAYLKGKIVLPISQNSQQNALGYKIFLTNSNELQAQIYPINPIKAKFFGDCTLTINSNSSFKVWLAQNEKFLITLNGNLNFGNVDILNIKRVNIQTKFQNVKIDYDEGRNQSEGKFKFETGQWSFASPQKKIAGFPVTIKNVKFDKRQSQGNELYRGALTFSVEVNLNEKFSGRSSLSIIGSISKNSNGKFEPDLKGCEIDTIDLNVNLSAVKAKGKIAFYNESSNQMYGNGFAGEIKATFNSIQMEVSSFFRVGSTKYNNGENYYRYWYVEAKAILPKEAAIQFLPGAAFYGFGAAAWQRISVSNLNKPSISEVANASTTSNVSTSGASFMPNNSIGFGFKVMAVMGTYPEPKTFNLDAALSGEFSNSGGLNKISFVTDFWAQADLLQRSSSPLYGNITIEYTPPDKLFMMSAQAFVKYPQSNPIIRSDGIGNPNDKISLLLKIDGKANKWYFIAGSPAQTNKVKILGVTSWEYLMFGNDIGQFVRTGFQPQTLQGLNSVGLYPTSPTTTIPSLAGTGRGFSFGAGVFYSVDKSLDLNWLSWAVGGRTPQLIYGGGGGFEINLSLLQYNGCNGNPIGFNNWYANGSLAAWLYGYAKVRLQKKNPVCLVCCKKKKDPDGYCEANLASLKVGFWTQGGFPNPSWVEGAASVHVNVFGLNWSGNVDINWGSKCSNIQQVSYSQTFVQETASEKTGNIIINVDPQNSDIFSPHKKINVFAAYDESPFEIPELQANGTIQMKTFKVVYSAELYKITFVQSGLIKIPQLQPQPLHRSNQLNFMNAYEYWSLQQSVQNLQRCFAENSKYLFKVRADLYEFKNGAWVKAKDKNGNDIFEIKTIGFETDQGLTTQTNANFGGGSSN